MRKDLVAQYTKFDNYMSVRNFFESINDKDLFFY